MTTPTLTHEHLKLFRSHFSLTQDQAAHLLSVSRVTWNRWESGNHSIPRHLTLTLRSVVADLKAAAEQAEKQEKEREALGL